MQAFDFLIINTALEVFASRSGDFCPNEEGTLCFSPGPKEECVGGGEWGSNVVCGLTLQRAVGPVGMFWSVSGFLGELHVSGN